MAKKNTEHLEDYEYIFEQVLIRAAKDYRNALKRLYRHPENPSALKTIKETEEFFLSEGFKNLYSIDPNLLIEGIRAKAKQEFLKAKMKEEGRDEELADIAKTLGQKYSVERKAIDGQIDALMHRTQDTTRDVRVFPSYDAIVIAKPTKPFDEKDKFLIDQYIMHGGKVLWLVEPVFATMDSLQNQESTIGIEQDLNLDDMLFRYGVRLNRDLLLDLTCAQLPIRTGQVGGQAQLEFFRWYYFPLLQAASDHPMVRNMNAIKADFVSSIDATTSANGIEQIPLLKTSSYTKVSGTPVFISLAMLRQAPDQRMFTNKGKNVAYLLKGSFPSLYANRIPQEIVDDQATDFLEESEPTAMIVVADGDIIRNQFDIRTHKPLPLGFDQYTGITYTNKEFIENAISYLVDGEGLIDIRSRELKVRLLDATKVNKERVKWQVINTVIPIALIIVLGLVMAFVRKKKYSKTEHHEEK